jgi:VanZ family protein
VTADHPPAGNHARRTTGLVSAWAPVVIYMAAIFFVSAQPDPPVPDGVSDKRLHAVAYSGLALLVYRAVASRAVTHVAILSALAIAAAYAVGDEVHQMFVPGRTADIYDVAADVAGASVALLGCWAWSIIRNPKAQLPTSRSGP